MLKKYKLVNVPEGGVDHLVEGYGKVSVTEERLTDEIAEKLIEAGLNYFEVVNDVVEPVKADENGKKTKRSTEAGSDAAA
ncbi:MAG: hypothetical protein EAZ80_01655 [Runella slithyformis]|nr:MAG: hypothetical protein EAZ80_01655 [Runella slithyformis]TAF48666.1 MAG: hypothetical protein EAZ63_03700 [Runella slithyformis]